MTDTPDHIKALQLKIWLSKTPAERIRQFCNDNDALMRFWNQAKKPVPAPNDHGQQADSCYCKDSAS